MKSIKMFGLTTIAMAIGIAVIFSLSMCKKVTDVQVVQTFNVSGVVTYTDANSNVANAHGAVLSIYPGVDTSAGALSRTFADASGNYKFTGLLPGSYIIFAKFNTVNQNARQISDGFNFISNPWYGVTISTANLTQNVTLVNIASIGTIQVATDTIHGNTTFRSVTFETHSKVNFSFPDNSDKGTSTSTTNSGINIAGGFNVFKMDNMAFDEANPQNTWMSGYVLLSTVNTFEPTRDAIGISGSGTNNLTSPLQATGCTHKTMDDYTDSALYYSNPANSPVVPLAGTDTARFVCAPGNVVRYGDGYVAHGTLTAFYRHITSGSIAGMTDGGYPYASDTIGFFAANGFAYNGPMSDGMTSVPVDLYFIYTKKQVTLAAGGYNWYFTFEGQFSFKPLSQFYLVSNGHLGDNPVVVSVNVNLIGTKNVAY